MTVGEVADENLQAYEEDTLSAQSPKETGTQGISLTDTIAGGKKGHLSEVDKATNLIGRLRLNSGLCPHSASSTPPNVDAVEKPLTENFIGSFNGPHLRPSMDLFSVGFVCNHPISGFLYHPLSQLTGACSAVLFSASEL